MSKQTVNSKLLIRLSSLGDVILASSALSVLSASERIDWATTKEHSELLWAHPKVHQIFEFDRKTGFRGWIQFCRESWDRHYTEVLDLHGNLRTLIMRVLFFYWGHLEPQYKPTWKTVPKQRYQLYGYFIFKELWPKEHRPTPWVQRFTELAGGSGYERPNLEHLLGQASLPFEILIAYQKEKDPLICVMPSSKWDGKKWPVVNYVRVLKTFPVFPIILGSSTDKESILLCDLLTAAKIPYISGVGKWDLATTARVLAVSKGYLGSDTGLAHLAEAVGVSAKIIFGPTTPDMGFAPWRADSLSIGKSIGCRPCGKDGRFCFRVLNRYSCLTDLSAQDVLAELVSDEQTRRRKSAKK